MKIKTWLLSSYLMVMILPLVAAYLLFAWINHYNQEKSIQEYLEVVTEIEAVKQVLKDESLYFKRPDEERILPHLDPQMKLTLFNKDGFILFTNKETYHYQFSLTQERLLTDLYELKQGYSFYEYKEPVFYQNDLIGFFQLEINRGEWLEAVSNRTTIVILSMLGVFALIFLLVVLLMNRKLNRPLGELMEDMTDFSKGVAVKQQPVSPDEIGELREHFYHMSEKIQEAQQVIRQEQEAKEYMIASISHDLKTPLTVVQAYAEALQTKDLSEAEEARYRAVIIEKAHFMKSMIDDLLTYTLLQSPSYEIERVKVDGFEFFDMLLSGYDELAEQNGLKLKKELAVFGSYLVHPQQMIRVLDNLMSNAVKFSKEGGSLYLAALSENKLPNFLREGLLKDFDFSFDDHAYIIVQNQGQGIALDELERLFDPLYQVDQARTKKEEAGTGLGLSIAKQIIEKHEGRIYLFSRINVGSCVLCEIPKLKGR